MERSSIQRVARRARLGYELGRLRRSLIWSAPYGLALATAAAHVATWRAATLAATAFMVLVAGRMIGRAIGRGVALGALAGLAPLLCPIVVTVLGHHRAGCGPSQPMPLCLVACATGGAVAAFLSWTRRGPHVHSVEPVAALGTAAIVGAVGCAVAGSFGLVGLALGMVLGGVPAVLVRAR